MFVPGYDIELCRRCAAIPSNQVIVAADPDPWACITQRTRAVLVQADKIPLNDVIISTYFDRRPSRITTTKVDNTQTDDRIIVRYESNSASVGDICTVDDDFRAKNIWITAPAPRLAITVDRYAIGDDIRQRERGADRPGTCIGIRVIVPGIIIGNIKGDDRARTGRVCGFDRLTQRARRSAGWIAAGEILGRGDGKRACRAR